jgi:DNA-binding transcriptional LysR family regulator
MNLNRFAAFRAVMLTGTVSGAAEILGRSQPAVSRLLDKLEYELGVALFERRKGLVTPTPQAHELLNEIERAYVSLEALQSFALRLAKGKGSHISLAALPAFANDFMPQVLSEFHKDWPETKVTLSVRMGPKIEEFAAAQQIDFGMAEMPFRRSGFKVEPFSTAPYVAAVPKGHALAERSSIGPEDLAKNPLILYSSFAPARHLLDQASQSLGIQTEAIIETNLSTPAYAMVKRGLGIAILDPFTAVLQRSDEVELIPFIPTIPFKVALLRPETRPSTPAMEALFSKMGEIRDIVLNELPG